MKFATVIFVVGLCLAAVTANVVPIEDNSVVFAAVETQSAFSGILAVTKGILTTLKAMNCAIQAAVQVQQSAIQFNSDVKSCGGIIPTQIQAIITSSNNVITDVDNIENADETICNTAGTDGTTSSSCSLKMLNQFVILSNDIQTTLTAIQDLPATGSATSNCFVTATTKLENTFTSFPAFMKSCSKLTSN